MAVSLGRRPWHPPLRVDGPMILISIDTLRADHLPAYGSQHVSTPALDALVANADVVVDLFVNGVRAARAWPEPGPLNHELSPE